MDSLKAEKLISILNKAYPHAQMALDHSTPFELLVATILSAQCTDIRVNKITQTLFKKYRSIRQFASADIRRLQQDIRSSGFFRNKAKNIKASAQMVIKRFGGRIPDTMDEILCLPGVARKTANIVLGNAYGVVEGIAVDTHVIRLSNRIGLSRSEQPEKIERDLMRLVKRKNWMKISYLLQFHGRAVCTARNPLHEKCLIKSLCSYYLKGN